LLRAALALIQPILPGRHRNELSLGWLAFSNVLTSRSDKIALSRMLHYWSARGIEPSAVTEGNFDEYRLHLDRSLLKRPDETFAMTASAGNTALFPGIDGGSKNQAFFGTQISRTVCAHTGLRVHPHLFRHIAAKLFLDANPGAYEVVRRVLGHRSIDTRPASTPA